MKLVSSVYRYFSRNTLPSNIPPIGDIYMIVDYEKPIDSGNGKKMYGYIDYNGEIPKEKAEKFGLEYATLNPIPVQSK